LLNLQANSLTDFKAMEALRDSHKRVKAISLIHQKLYGFEDIASIPLEEYINALFADLKMVYAANHVQMECKTEPDGIRLDMESAVPVGLILNETITNALKYAFADKAAGVLLITFTESGDDTYTLSVKDNGIGLPENFDPEKSSSLGFRIIKELTRQLRGKFAYTTDNGTLFSISFPNTSARKKMS
jgi:two-component sensor histidine kinase